MRLPAPISQPSPWRRLSHNASTKQIVQGRGIGAREANTPCANHGSIEERLQGRKLHCLHCLRQLPGLYSMRTVLNSRTCSVSPSSFEQEQERWARCFGWLPFSKLVRGAVGVSVSFARSAQAKGSVRIHRCLSVDADSLLPTRSYTTYIQS